MMRCPQCGFDQVRAGAKFCPVCRAAQPAAPANPPPVVSPPRPVQSAQPLSVPPAPSPVRGYQQQRVAPMGRSAGGQVFPLKQWDKPPQVEGLILHVDGPVQENRKDLAGRAVAGCFLAMLITPFLAFLPFLGGTKLDVRFLRVQDAHTGQEFAVKIIGEPSGPVHQGDTVAIWAKMEQGTWQMIAGYNYNTNSEIRLRR